MLLCYSMCYGLMWVCRGWDVRQIHLSKRPGVLWFIKENCVRTHGFINQFYVRTFSWRILHTVLEMRPQIRSGKLPHQLPLSLLLLFEHVRRLQTATLWFVMTTALALTKYFQTIQNTWDRQHALAILVETIQEVTSHISTLLPRINQWPRFIVGGILIHIILRLLLVSAVFDYVLGPYSTAK